MSTDNFNNRELAIVALTRQGTEQGRQLKDALPGSSLFLPDKFCPASDDESLFGTQVKDAIAKAFSKYRYLALIMATGIAVRLVAPLLKSKHNDPAVVVMDEAASFVISLVSGHKGGANELAKMLASISGAIPVITTSSDVNETISVDLIGSEFGWQVDDDDNVTVVSAAVVNGEKVGVLQEAGEKGWWRAGPLPANINVYPDIEALNESGSDAAIIITDCILGNLPGQAVVFRPKSLVVGVGCNRDTGAESIEKAVLSSLEKHGLSLKSVRNLATIDLKKDEKGFLEFAAKYGFEIDYFDQDALNNVETPSGRSETVMKHVGAQSVAEAAAMLSSSQPVIVPKESYGRAVTVAVARTSGIDTGQPANGKLFLVGTGPGSVADMTERAREAISSSQVIVGYKSYVKLVEALVRDKEVIDTGMTQEVQRARAAIEIARQGKVVSLVCSGDSGIYGMAGLIGEMLKDADEKLDVEVVPGVPALVSSAALLGAPLTGDFASISLSDYLVAWEDIARRLKNAAAADFVIVLYNPRSKKRQRHLIDAVEIISKYRQPATPAGIVRNAGRDGQQIVHTDLEHLLDNEIDMNTTIIIGNSSTFSFKDWMVTPRGYSGKYDLDDKS